jgi:DNA-binding NarL/FixJ family response regulator
VRFEGWIFLRGEPVPGRWRERASAGYLVPLLPGEATQLLDAVDALDPSEDEELVRLVARGLAAPEIAAELGKSLRSTQRHLARLRRRFGVATTAELATILRDRGFR